MNSKIFELAIALANLGIQTKSCTALGGLCLFFCNLKCANFFLYISLAEIPLFSQSIIFCIFLFILLLATFNSLINEFTINFERTFSITQKPYLSIFF